MKAVMLVDQSKLEVGDVPEPEPGAADVVVAVAGVGICGSDLSVFRGHKLPPRIPWVVGHEAFGTIKAVGSDISPDRIGETVVIEPNFPCMECDICRAGRSSLCPTRTSVGMNRPGALAERFSLPSRFAWPIHGISAEAMSCIEPTVVADTALARLPRSLPDRGLVIGGGAQGLLATLCLVGRGCVVHIDAHHEDRVALAVELGAVPAPPPDERPMYDLVVDTVGTPDSFTAALRAVAPRGMLLQVGLDARPTPISAELVVRRQLTMVGSLIYDHPRDFARVIRFVEDGIISPGRIVRHVYAMADAQEAFERAASLAGKSWIALS
jgi:alcohol dehydrogenase/L-iditol 2-dehydrogenase